MKNKDKPFTLSTLEQLKALADPIRYQVFENLVEEAKTAKQVADLMGLKPTRLYHHFKVLEDVGIIHQVETRKKRGTIEKYYKAVKEKFTIAPELVEGKPLAAASMLGSAFQTTAMELADIAKMKKKNRPVVAGRVKMKFTLKEARELEKQIKKILDGREDSSKNKRGEEYAFTVAFYPRSLK